MRKSKIFKTIAFLSILALLTNCKEIEEVSPEPNIPVVNWNKLENFQERVYNMSIINEKLYATGTASYFSDIDVNNDLNPQFFWNYIARTGRYKLPISSKVLVSRSETEIFIFPSDKINPENLLRVPKEDFDAEFRFFEDIPRWEGDFIGLTNSGIALFPYRKIIKGFAKNSPNFLLIKAEVENDVASIKDYKIIDRDVDNLITNFNNCSRIESFDDFFLVQIGQEIYKITTEGVISEFTKSQSRSVQVNNTTYSFANNINKRIIEVFASDRLGNDINLIGQTEYNEIFTRGEFFEVNNQIVIAFRNNIFHVILENGNIKIIELENSNLDAGDIYEIILLPDNTVLVSNICNTPNCGVFKKDLKDFFQQKIDVVTKD